MFSIVSCEFFKLKRLRLLWLIVITAFFTGMLEFSAITYQKHTQQNMFTWDWLMFTNIRYVTLLIIPIVVSLLMGFIVAREFQENTANAMFTYGYPRNWFLIGKYLVTVPILFILVLLEFFVTIGSGLLLSGHPELKVPMIENYMGIFSILFLMTLCFVPAAVLVSILFKSYIVSALFGLIVLIVGAVTVNSNTIGLLFPWSAPNIILSRYFPHRPYEALQPDYWKGYLSLLLVFIIPLIINFRIYKNMDILNT
jgi:ABC-type transport system involved in multi-copper enzyme maturation permease subunit